MYALIVGNPVTGITVYGPFDYTEAAKDWAEENVPCEDSWIVPLNTPNTED